MNPTTAEDALLIPLELLATGEWARVAELHGESGWHHRMAELGLQPGCRVQMIRSGSPCLLRVGESRLCLRADWAMHILVEPCADPDAAAPGSEAGCRLRTANGKRPGASLALPPAGVRQ